MEPHIGHVIIGVNDLIRLTFSISAYTLLSLILIGCFFTLSRVLQADSSTLDHNEKTTPYINMIYYMLIKKTAHRQHMTERLRYQNCDGSDLLNKIDMRVLYNE